MRLIEKLEKVKTSFAQDANKLNHTDGCEKLIEVFQITLSTTCAVNIAATKH